MSSEAPSKKVKDVNQSSMVKRIKTRMAMTKMQPTADLFNLPKNTVTKQMNVSDIEKLKQIYEAKGNAAQVWGGEGIQAVSYKDIIAVPNKAELFSSKIVTTPTSVMREKIMRPQISPSRTANHRFVHFPMNSNGKRKDVEPFQWTLLVLDQKEGD
eukprot:TRINITY_DN6185_c0_g2_i5.p2 TRINITY_DN6185_c0_g2~~TRINITY_DN6185_c0_g2_i5.p2  ORF type:complete len:156 (-),score=21.68 TRINITY_DN6185_c0_g2_i5:633-1100(-)